MSEAIRQGSFLSYKMAEWRKYTSQIESFLDSESDKETEEIVEEGDKDAESEKKNRRITEKKEKKKSG